LGNLTPVKLFPIFLALSLAAVAHAQKLSPLAPAPKWSDLNQYQQSITREDFLYLLEEVYAPGGAWKQVIEVDSDKALIRTATGEDPFVLRFASSGRSVQPIERTWRSRSQLGPRTAAKPLLGVRIGLDPGHLGGDYAKMEERWFQIGNSKPVMEGNMTLAVAELLKPELERLGAKVFLTRSKPGPVTSLRPGRLKKEARESLEDQGKLVTKAALETEAERLFYRAAEIRARAKLVNEKLKPDLVLCLHFNAESWGNPDRPRLVDENHLHFLVTGAFSAAELEYADQRFDMLVKLLSRAYREELAVTEAIADSMVEATGLPPYVYRGSNAVKVGTSPYVWGRNLLANRLFECPVVYVEPYVMNSEAVFVRVQAGDFSGKRAVGGRLQESIYREYARGIVEGLVAYYSEKR
jgi:N-acetylmuramoyl-L-alanine amidase